MSTQAIVRPAETERLQRSGTAKSRAAAQVTLRRFPFPYRCALAISSDLDQTPNARAYDHLLRFLNTEEMTDFGPGVGIECANSIYFEMPSEQFAYWNAEPIAREMVRTYIESGHVDVLHSYGDLASTRAQAVRALEELERYGCGLPVWVDHSKAPTNLGADIMAGSGDVVGSPAYHSDLTAATGIRFVWRGRVTSVIGQDSPHTTRGVAAAGHPLRSGRTIIKEQAKHYLGRSGNCKYAMHATNALYRPVKLRDGTPVLEFMRFNPHWAGVAHADTASALAESLSGRVLDQLSAREGASILYTHLGKIFRGENPELPAACQAMRTLRGRFDQGTTLVTTTSRLLRFVEARDSLRFTVFPDAGRTLVRIDEMHDPLSGCSRAPRIEELSGLTFEAPGRRAVDIVLADLAPLPCEIHQGAANTYAMIPWRRLPFPRLA